MRFLYRLFLLFIVISSSTFSEEISPPKTGIKDSKTHNFDFRKVYGSSPVIYTILLLMSSSAGVVWLYTQASFRRKQLMPSLFIEELQGCLKEKNFDSALSLCRQESNLLASIMTVGLTSRCFGSQIMMDSMKSEAKRLAASYWQRLSILNDIAIVAPMLGLLGTVMGMFYAFYDVNRSMESMNAVFDGLGVSVGTTVVGLIVAIFSMTLAATLKYRLIKNFSRIENEAFALSVCLETEPTR